MSFASEWAPLLTWSVTVETVTGKDSYGNLTTSSTAITGVHVDEVTEQDQGTSGRDGVAAPLDTGVTMYAPPGVLSLRDIVTLPDGRVTNVSSITTRYDNDGAEHHVEARLETDRSA